MDVEKLLSELTLEEKAAFCSGLDFSHTKPVERLGIPAFEKDRKHGRQTEIWYKTCLWHGGFEFKLIWTFVASFTLIYFTDTAGVGTE
jgi:hypothetical protein